MYTKIMFYVFIAFGITFLVVAFTSMFCKSKKFDIMRTFMDYTTYVILALVILLFIALALDGVLFDPIQTHTYF